MNFSRSAQLKRCPFHRNNRCLAKKSYNFYSVQRFCVDTVPNFLSEYCIGFSIRRFLGGVSSNIILYIFEPYSFTEAYLSILISDLSIIYTQGIISVSNINTCIFGDISVVFEST